MPTVSPEELIDVVIAADAQRRRDRGMAPGRFRPSQRVRIEPFFNLLGWCWGFFLRILPGVFRRPLDIWLCQKMEGHAPEENPQLSERTTQAVTLARKLYQQTGQWPAVFILTSHPETEGSLAWLRFELLRQGLLIAAALVEAAPTFKDRGRHAQCFLAIDPYALDTVSPAVGGFYAAWMHQAFLAWDRQPSTQSWIQQHFFLRDSGYPHIGWRLLSRLRKNIPILMVLSGGLPHNARLLYTAREFIQSLPIAHGPVSKRAAQKCFMEIIMQPVNGIRPTERGELPGSTVEKAKAYLKSVGLQDATLESAWKRFEEEFRSAVPYRERLFRILKLRFLKKGKPVLLIAISHRTTAPYVQISEPVDLSTLIGHFVDGRFF